MLAHRRRSIEVVHECPAVECNRESCMRGQVIDGAVCQVDVRISVVLAQESNGCYLLCTLGANKLCTFEQCNARIYDSGQGTH